MPKYSHTNKKPTLLMVSGGSDSVAMLHMCVSGDIECGPLKVLHVNHLLRGNDSQADEQLVRILAQRLHVECEVRSIHVAQLAQKQEGGIEATARQVRYECADQVLDSWCYSCGVSPEKGQIYTAHTLNDRVEMFYMRSLVGTGPGGLASIPRKRGRIVRPLLDFTREDLREYIRKLNPHMDDQELWREDKTNYDGSNFRGQVRTQLMPVLEHLRPGFMKSLSRTMDLTAEENDYENSQAQSILARSVVWNGNAMQVPLCVLQTQALHRARRIVREALLMVDPDARLESKQIERILHHINDDAFVTEVSGGIRVVLKEDMLLMKKRADMA